MIYEIIGYAASLLVAASLMMGAIVKLRIVNMAGAFTFAIYGLLIGSIPVAAMNGFIVLINIFFLVRIFQNKEYFQILKTRQDSSYLKAFLQYYHDSILTCQPHFKFDQEHNYSIFILNEMVPAGVILGNLSEEGDLHIDLDFVIPSFRDFKIGSFLFKNNLPFFEDEGVRVITTAPGNKQHNEYLERIGFRKEDTDNRYVLPVTLTDRDRK